MVAGLSLAVTQLPCRKWHACIPLPPPQRKREEYEEQQRRNEGRRRHREAQREQEEEARRAADEARAAQRQATYDEAQRKEAARVAEVHIRLCLLRRGY